MGISSDIGPGTHSRGIARILQARGHCGPRGDFEKQLLLTLRGPVVQLWHKHLMLY